MSFYAGSAGSVVMQPAPVGHHATSYAVPVAQSVQMAPQQVMMQPNYQTYTTTQYAHAAPTYTTAQPVYAAAPQPQVHMMPMTAVRPTQAYYTQPVAALPAVPHTAAPIMYGRPNVPMYYGGQPTVIVGSPSDRRRHKKHHSSRGFLGYL